MSFSEAALFVSLPIFGIAFVLAFIRLMLGPSLPDRVVALDLMAVIGIGFIATYSIYADRSVFVDVATVVALIGFLATVAFAYHVRRGSG
jgi:multicomponent Na+:H+ antiporter subunit F